MRKRIPSARRYKSKIGVFGKTDCRTAPSVLPLDTSPLTYNFDMTSGALRAGYGTELHASVPQRAARYWVYKFYSEKAAKYVEQYIFQMANGLIQYYDPDKDRAIYLSGKQYPPISAFTYRLNSVDTFFFIGKDQKLTSWDGTNFITHQSSPSISSMALHYERLFVTSATEPTKVFFSDDLDPTNWQISSDGAGFIELLDERGFLNKVVSFGSYLYIFRDHGISRVTAYGDQREFAAVNLFVTAGRIFPSSIATCGSVIMFLASDGLYVFDGYECKRVLYGYDGLINADDDCSCEYFNGKYYLACKMNFGDNKTVGCESAEYKTNGLIVYDPMTGESSLSRGLNITFMHTCTYNGEDFLMCNESGTGCVITRCGARCGTALPKHWESPMSDFGIPQAEKHIHAVCAATAVPYVMTLKSERGKKTARVLGTVYENRTDFSGKRIALELDCYVAKPDISPPTLVYATYE